MGLLQNNGLSHTKRDLSHDAEISSVQFPLYLLESWGNICKDISIARIYNFSQNISQGASRKGMLGEVLFLFLNGILFCETTFVIILPSF